METINNLKDTAVKAIWGETGSTEEPVSGQKGDVSRGEPYDSGNLGGQPGQISRAAYDDTTTATDTTSTNTNANTDTNTDTNTNTNTGTSTDPKINGSSSTAAAGKQLNSAEPKPDVSSGPAPQRGQKKDSSTTPGDSTASQNDVRSPADEQAHPDASKTRARSNVDDAADGPDADQNPQKVEGPGPKPVDELARERGGDAGRTAERGKTDGGDDDGVQKESHGQGTGEQYVKSSGLAADGGDFDASKPGAGREADRLLGEKGIHVNSGGDEGGGAEKASGGAGKAGGGAGKAGEAGGTGDHKKLSQKVKGKLHIGHKS